MKKNLILIEKTSRSRLRGSLLGVLSLCLLSLPLDLFAGSKSVLAEDMPQAAQEERFAQMSPVGTPGNVLSEEQWVMLVYQKGKESYDRGDYKASTAEWDKLSGVIDRYPAFKTVIDYLRGRAKNISPEAAAQVEQQLAARRKQIDSAFQKGKEFYDQGKMNEALMEWDKLSSYLPDDAPQRRLIADLKKYYTETAINPADRVLTKESSSDMLKFFASASELFKTQATQAKKALADAENAQGALDRSFSASKMLYYQGNYAGAMQELQKMASYFPEGSKERESLESLVRVYGQAMDEKAAANDALSQKSVKARLPEDFSKFAQEMNEKFQADLKEAETRRVSSEKVMEDKQSWMSDDFKKGADAYRQGRIDEAVRLWEAVAPSFENERTIREMIEIAKKNQEELKRIKVEQDNLLAERQALINGRLEKGRLQYEAGNFEEAKSTWASLAGLVQNDKELENFIAQIQKVHQDTLKLAQLEKESRTAAAQPVKTSESFSALITAAQQKLSAQLDRSRQAQSSAEAVAKRQASVQEKVEKGRQAFEAGDIEKARQEWGALRDLVDDPKGVDEFLSAVQKVHEENVRLKAEEAAAREAGAARLAMPETLSIYLRSSKEKLQTRATEASQKRLAAESTVRDRKALVDKTVQKGKDLVDGGKIKEAILEWGALLPLVENESELKRSLDALSADLEAAARSEEDAREAATRQNAKVALPEDLSKLLSEAGRLIRAQSDTTHARRKQAEQSLIDRQAFVSEHFTKGKALYEGGRYEEALKEWSSLLDSVEGGESLKTSIQEVALAQKELSVAQASAAEADAKKLRVLPAPAELSKLLTEAADKLRYETDGSRKRAEDSRTALAAREKLVQNTYEKGKALFDEGKYSEAVREWTALADEVESSDELRAQLKQIEDLYELSIESSKASEMADLKKNAKLPAPPALKNLLAEVQLKIEKQSLQYAGRKTEAEKVLTQRQQEADAVFAKGKTLYEEGKIAEALTQWAALLPSLEDEATLREKIASIQSDLTRSQEIAKAAEDSEKRQSGKIAAPAELETALADLSVRMKGEIELAQSKKNSADRSIDDKKTRVTNTFDKGKTLYEEGRYKEALDEWAGILPSLDNGDALKVLWDAAAKEYEQLAFSQKAASDAEARIDQKLRSPESLLSFLQAMTDQLRIRTLEVKNRKTEADHVREMKQSEIDKAVMKGNALFREGDIEAAQKEWLSILPSVEDEASVRTTIEALSKIHEERQALKKMEEETLAMPQNRVKAPSDISTELSDASQKLAAQRTEAEAKRQAADQIFAKRQAELQQTFDQGKKLYWEGKIADAIRSWASIAPLLEDSEIKKGIDALAAEYEKLLSLQKTAQESELKKDGKLRTPEELPKILTDARQVIQSQTQYADTQKKIADQTFVDRQALINTTFQKGKKLYEEDRIPEALEEWASIAPYLEKGSELKQYIDSVASHYEASIVAKRAAEEAQVKKAVKFRTPEDMSRYLNEASSKLTAQVEDSRMQKEAAERLRRERQILVDSKFQKGKILYEKGRVSDAIDEWKAILPYIEDDSKVRQLILKAEENRQILKGVTAEPAPVLQPVSAPEGMKSTLESANQTLEKTVKEQNRQKLEADVRDLIQDKKKKLKQPAAPKNAVSEKVALDEIEQMMLEYNIATPAELEKRHQELKAVK